ncbi:hypothetical protein JCM10450v2_007953 [Rhodotorula kratochvilovae]
MAPFPDEDPPSRASSNASHHSDPGRVWIRDALVEQVDPSHHSTIAGEAGGQSDPRLSPSFRAPASLAASRVSDGSAVRREAARSRYEAEAQARRDALEQEERARWAAEEQRLKEEDLLSERAHGFPAPRESAADAEPDVLRRKVDAARAEADRLEALYARRTASAPPGRQYAFTPLARPPSSSPPVTLSVKLKVKEPKPWTGKFDYTERENWARSVTLYLGSHGVALDSRIGEHATPEIFYAIRTLFSSDSGADGISPQVWFDAANSRAPFVSLRAVLEAVKAHWTDDAAVEKAFMAYRNARQGSMLDVVAGLNYNVLDFVKTQIAARKALGVGEPTFAETVNIAAQTDSLSAFRRADKPATSSSSSSTRKATGTDAPPRQGSSSSPPPVGKPPSNWLKAAREWQQKYPIGSKNDWHDPKAPVTSGDMRCYNCGEVGRHWSKACTKSRKDPDVIIIAALQRMSMGKSLLSQSSSPATSGPGTSDPNVVTEGSPSSDSSGNGDDA